MADSKSVVKQVMDSLAKSTQGVTIPDHPIEQTKPEKPEYPPPKEFGGANPHEKRQKDYNSNFDGNRNSCNHQ